MDESPVAPREVRPLWGEGAARPTGSAGPESRRPATWQESRRDGWVWRAADEAETYDPGPSRLRASARSPGPRAWTSRRPAPNPSDPRLVDRVR